MNAIVLVFLLVALCFSMISTSILGSNWVAAVSRNPEASDRMFLPGIICLSAIEITSICCIGGLFIGILS